MKRKNEQNTAKCAEVSTRFFVSGLFYLLMLFSCKENDDELKNPKTESPPSFEDPALPVEAYGGETITFTVNNFDFDKYSVTINGQKVRAYGVSLVAGSFKTIKCEIPYGLGSGTIDLVPLDGGTKISGPKFTYLSQYRVYRGDIFFGENGISRYTDDSFITSSTIEGKFQIYKLAGFRTVDFGSFCQFRRKSITIKTPVRTMWAVPATGHFATGVTSTGKILTSCKTEGSFPNNNIYETDLKQTHFFAGRNTVPEYEWIHDLDLDSHDNIYTCETDGWPPKSNDLPYINRTTLLGVTRFAGSEDKGHVDGQGLSARFYSVRSIAIDKNDNLYVADSNYVRKISPNAEVTTIAGNAKPGDKDGVGLEAEFNSILSLYVADDTLYILDNGNGKIKVMDLRNNSVKTLKGIDLKKTIKEPKGFGARMLVDVAKNIHIVVDFQGGSELHSCIREDNVPKDILPMWANTGKNYFSELVK